MKSYYSKAGDNVFVVGSADSITNELEALTYVVKFNPQNGQFYLQVTPDMELPEKIYGGLDNRADRIMNTYFDRPNNTGVLLQGEKGSGKTLLIKQLSKNARARGLPTIIVSAEYKDDNFTTFITSITCEALVVFDEFDKVYEKQESQNLILSLLDGVSQGRKLYVLTVNNKDKVSQFFVNRPSRIFYNYTYTGLEESFVREYCLEKLDDQSQIDDIIRVTSVFTNFNFDMLKSMVEEMNRYKETAKQVVNHINIDSKTESARWSVESIKIIGDEIHDEDDDEIIKVVEINPDSKLVSNGNYVRPLSSQVFVTYKVKDDKGKEFSNYRYLDVCNIDSVNNGIVTYKMPDMIVKITREANRLPIDYSRFMYD